VLEGHPVPQRLAVAGKQDQRRGVGGLGRERQVQEDERERVEVEQQDDVADDPDQDDGGLDDDEPSAAQERGHIVGDVGPERRLVAELAVDGVPARGQRASVQRPTPAGRLGSAIHRGHGTSNVDRRTAPHGSRREYASAQ
jgi:hypothetical protein